MNINKYLDEATPGELGIMAAKRDNQLRMKKYPELDLIARIMAKKIYTEIGQRTAKVDSAMPYKAQYVLEEIIEHLKEMV
jgi:hypothetical protein